MMVEFAYIRSQVHVCIQQLIFRFFFDITRIQITRVAAGKSCYQGIVVDVMRVMGTACIVIAPENIGRDITYVKCGSLPQIYYFDAFIPGSAHHIVAHAYVILHVGARSGHVSVVGKIQLADLVLSVIEDIRYISDMVIMIMADVYIKIRVLMTVQPIVEHIPGIGYIGIDQKSVVSAREHLAVAEALVKEIDHFQLHLRDLFSCRRRQCAEGGRGLI